MRHRAFRRAPANAARAPPAARPQASIATVSIRPKPLENQPIPAMERTSTMTARRVGTCPQRYAATRRRTTARTLFPGANLGWRREALWRSVRVDRLTARQDSGDQSAHGAGSQRQLRSAQCSPATRTGFATPTHATSTVGPIRTSKAPQTGNALWVRDTRQSRNACDENWTINARTRARARPRDGSAVAMTPQNSANPTTDWR